MIGSRSHWLAASFLLLPTFCVGLRVGDYPLNGAAITFFVYAALSVARGMFVGHASLAFAGLFGYILFMMVVADVVSARHSVVAALLVGSCLVPRESAPEERSRVLRATRVSAFCQAVLVLLDFGLMALGLRVRVIIPEFIDIGLSGEFGARLAGRAFGLFDEPAHAAICLVMTRFVAGYGRLEGGATYGKKWVANLVYFAAIMATKSLAGVLLMGVAEGALIFRGAWQAGRMVGWRARAGIAVIGVLIVAGIFLASGGSQRLSRVGDVMSSSSFAREGMRVNAYVLIPEILAVVPSVILGAGVGAEVGEFVRVGLVEEKVANGLVVVAVQGGVLGLVLYGVFLLRNAVRVGWAAVVMFFLMNMAAGSFYMTWFWMFFAASVFLGRPLSGPVEGLSAKAGDRDIGCQGHPRFASAR